MNDARPGMGAICYDGGTAFRVWAPHADNVRLMGSFNDWQADATPMQSEGNGNWYVDVPGAGHGDEYTFVLTTQGNTFERFDPRAAQVTNSVGKSVIYDHRRFDWGGDSFSPASLNELVIYEMHVGSFLAEGDGPATLWDARNNLQHLQDLGVNALQLMPVMEFAGDYSWGYNPAHLFAVESVYGGPDALKNFVKTAHEMGFAVIIDVVYNHFGPSDLATWQFDGWSENGKGGIYFYNDWRAATPWGETRPDYGRPEVRDFIRDNAFMWLRDYHADGLRYDMTPFIASSVGGSRDIPEGWALMQWVNDSIRSEFPQKFLIAEDLHNDPAVTDPGPDGAHFHAQWDAKFVHPVREAAIEDFDEHRDIAQVREAIEHRFGLDAFSRVVYTESHDEVANGRARVPQEIDGQNPESGWAQKRSTSAASIVFTSPGVPMLFQGQEFLENGWFRDTVPLDWARNDDFRGIVRLYRDLIRLRRNWRNTTRGLAGQGVNVFHTNEDANVLAFHRWMDGGPGDDVVVIVNMSAQAYTDYRVGMPYAGEWVLELNSDARVYSDAFGDTTSGNVTAGGDGQDGQAANALIDIGPYTTLIYSRA